MATTTATIFIGKTHPYHSGIIPTHLIQLTENDRPALILQDLKAINNKIVIIPTVENVVDDIFLMIAVYVYNLITPPKKLDNPSRDSLYELLTDQERIIIYQNVKRAIQGTNIKVVFNILEYSHLINLIEEIKKYSVNYEVTTPFIKNEFDVWQNKTIYKEF